MEVKFYYSIFVTIALSYSKIGYGQQERSRINNLMDTTTILQLIATADRIEHMDSAATIYTNAYRLSHQYNFPKGKAMTIESKAIRYVRMGAYGKALILYKQAAEIGKTHQLPTGWQPRLIAKIGDMHQYVGNYDSAIYYYYNALHTDEKNLPESTKLSIYNNLGNTLNMVGEYDKALYYLSHSRLLNKKNKNPFLLGATLINMAIAYSTKGQADSALFYYREGLAFAKREGIPTLIHNSYANLGKFYLQENQPEKALQTLLEAEKYASAVNYYYSNSNTAFIGIAYSRLKNYSKAEKYLVQALAQANDLKLARNSYEIYSELATVYAATGRYNEAFTHLHDFIVLKDSIMSAATLQDTKKLEARYRSAQKDKELTENKLYISQQKAKIREQYFWIYGIASAALLLGITFFSLYRVHKYRKDKQVQLLQQQQEIAQLKAVMQGEEQERSRLARELHDGIGGMLASIRMNLSVAHNEYAPMVNTGKLEALMVQVQDTAAEVRKTAHNLMPEVLTKHSLAEALVIYCDSINKGRAPEIELKFKGNWHHLDKATELMLYRMVQEMIQNILKHAQANYAILQLVEENGKVMIFVEDDGKGFEVAGTYSGYGLQNLRHRVQALKGELSIMSDPGKGTAIYIEFDRDQL